MQACLGRVTIARQLAGAFAHNWSGAVHLHGSSHILLLGSSRVVFTIRFGWLVLAHSNRSSLRSGTCAASVASLSLARMRSVPVRGTAADLRLPRETLAVWGQNASTDPSVRRGQRPNTCTASDLQAAVRT